MHLMQDVVRKEKRTLVMVTHDNHLAEYADRVFRIIDGKIVKIEENHHEKEESLQEKDEGSTGKKTERNPVKKTNESKPIRIIRRKRRGHKRHEKEEENHQCSVGNLHVKRFAWCSITGKSTGKGNTGN